MTDMREAVARIIDPSTWAVLDSYLADAKRKYAKSNAGYDPEAFKDRKSLAKAAEIEALMQPEIDRRVAEERAKLLERLRAAVKNTPALTVDLIRHEDYSGEHREWKEPITFPQNAAFYETVLEAIIQAMLAQFEKENSHEQG